MIRLGGSWWYNCAYAIIARSHTPGMTSRDMLMLGATLEVSGEIRPSQLAIRCTETSGVPIKFPDAPVVVERRSGMVIHAWRGFVQLALGPLSAIFLLCTLFLYRETSTSKVDSSNWRRQLLFSVVAFFYSLSLAYYYRLFLNLDLSYVLHAGLRCSLSYCLIRLASLKERTDRLAKFMWILSVAALSSAAWYNATIVVDVYRVLAFCSALVTLLAATEACFRTPDKKVDVFWGKLLMVAGMFQLLDLVSIKVEVISAQYPVLIAILCGFIGSTVRSESRRKSSLFAAAYEILRTIQQTGDVSNSLRRVVEVVKVNNPLVRLSAYIDSYCIGLSEQPATKLQRIFEFGYKKDTSADETIEIVDGRGKYMIEAIRRGEPVWGVGRDGGQFVSLPVGKHACINLSDDEAREPFHAEEAKVMLSYLEPAIRTLDLELQKSATQSRLAINALRVSHGIGNFDVRIACIFVDIADFSLHAEKYGSPFVQFISDSYLPTLTRLLQNNLVVEFTRGDEVYFCALEGFPLKNSSLESSLLQGLSLLDSFMTVTSQNLSTDNGFPPLKLRVGATIGRATLAVSETEVKTLGQIVNSAKRLQDAAKPGQILVSPEFAAIFAETGVHLSPVHPRLVKGNLISAQVISFPEAGGENRKVPSF